MNRVVFGTVLAMLCATAASAQEPAGSLTLTMDGEERPFVLIQGAEGANPGSRFSTLGQDVVMTIVGVLGEEPQDPKDAEATIELKFTVDKTGPEVRTGSVLSYSTLGGDGNPVTRGGTVEVSIDELEHADEEVTASGSFAADLPPSENSSGAAVEGTFRTAMRSSR